MKEFIEANGGIIPAVLILVIAMNLFLSGLHAALGKLKDLTKSKADDNIYEILTKVLGVSQKIVEWASANRPNPPKQNP